MLVRVNDHIKEAMEKGIPVVALESTIISHGMPYPQNVETALKVEEIIRSEGAMPATIGIIDGECVVGMTPDEIEQFGKRKGIAKVSRRDLPVIIAKKEWGATTVATTMIIAAHAGVKVFVTGGIGGVHREAQQTFDISADLDEFAKTNVCVICAGAKAILDLPLTLEYLETKGVPVLGYQTKELPAFYTRESGLDLDYQVDTPEEIAAIMKAKWDMKLDGGLVIANPIPVESSMDKDVINKAIEEALVEAKKQGIKGKDTTPFLLAKVKEITGGESLDSNIQLVFNNAKLGARIAKEYGKL
ncbi:MAG: pseudouridine-5'-phosphate glycosidase [Erysipelotrichales bacterium]|nr:pseudouridine-5'-phosphate glycosidase [Erysipelotrichales bacterium]